MRRVKLLIPIVILAGCSAVEPKAQAQQPETVKLEAGTPIKAVLMKELTSGGSREGEEVPLMLSEDVKDPKGRILIPKGTPISGSVTWSRNEGTLGSLLNQPARLKFKVEHVKAVDGATVKISPEKAKPEDFELNRENTGKITASQTLENLAKDKSNEAVLEAVRDLFEKGEAAKLDSPETRAKLASIAQEMSLPSTSKLLEDNQVDKVTDLVQQIRRGAALTNLATGGSASIVDAALELAGVAGQVGNRLERMLGGRNIRALVGTSIDLYVLETVEIKVK
jgi:hypothetical protein